MTAPAPASASAGRARARLVLCATLSATAALGAPPRACAQPAVPPGGDLGTWLEVSAFRPSVRSEGRADWVAAGRPGTPVSFERDLGLQDTKTLPSLLLGTRVGERWWLELEVLALRRAGSRRLEREIVWDDTVYPVSASLESRFESDVARLSAGWSLLSGPSHEVGAVLGLHVTRFEVELSGRVAAGPVAAGGSTERQEVLVPLPTIGVQGRLALGEGWDLRGRLDWFALSGDGWHGALTSVVLGLHWVSTPQFGLSLGWRLVDYRFGGQRDDWRGEVRYRFSGPSAGVVLRF